MAETKKEYTQEQLNKMTYKQLRQAAIDSDISPAGLNLKDLKMVLGAAPENATVVDNAEGMSADELERRRTLKQRIPGKTIYWDRDDKEFWKVKANNPEAFDNIDFTDATAKAQHVFKSKVKCVKCGEKFKMQREYQKAKDGVLTTFVDKSPCEIKACPKCGTVYYYHNTEEDWEILAE